MRVAPGDVAEVVLSGAGESAHDVEQIERVREELGLDHPLFVQYGDWLWSLVNGDFGGRSFVSREGIPSIIARQAPVTMLLTLYAGAAALLAAIPLGALAARAQGPLARLPGAGRLHRGPVRARLRAGSRDAARAAYRLRLDAAPGLRRPLGRPVAARPHHGSPRARAGIWARRRAGPHDPSLAPGDAGAGLRPRRPRKGAERARGALPSRPAPRRDSHHHRGRTPGRRAAQRRGGRRGRLRPTRAGARRRRRGGGPRLPRGPGAGHAARLLRPLHQPDRGTRPTR